MITSVGMARANRRGRLTMSQITNPLNPAFRILAVLLLTIALQIGASGCTRGLDTENGRSPLPARPTAEADTVTFPDPSLDYAIRTRIEKPSGDMLRSDLEDIAILRVTDKGISNLEGLQYCVNLEVLDLSINQIADIGPLAGLTQLTELTMTNNQISDLSSLSELANLTKLVLGNNQIADLTPLAELTNLNDLALYRNQVADITPLSSLNSLRILVLGSNNVSDLSPLSSLTELAELGLGANLIADISPLATLTQLTSFNLGNNMIEDLSPLLDNHGIGAGDEVALRNNPLSDEAINEQIPALRERGVTVIWE